MLEPNYKNRRYLLTVKDAADDLKVSRATIRRWVEDGIINAVRVGRRWVLFRREELDRQVNGEQCEEGQE